MHGAVKRSVSELSHQLELHLGTNPACLAVLEAMRDPNFADELATLVESSPTSFEHGGMSDRAIADACFVVAKRSSSIELCRTALDWYPVHTGALSLFEELADESLKDELCARYQVFLEDAPLHGVPSQTCADVLGKLTRTQEEMALWDFPEIALEEGQWEEKRDGLLVQDLLRMMDPQNDPPGCRSSK